MSDVDNIKAIRAELQNRGLPKSFGLTAFKHPNQSVESRINFRRNDDGREADTPFATALELLRKKARWSSVDALWGELEKLVANQ